MRLIFLGPPGVGKGTQAKQICEHYKIIHLSTGEILRKEIFDKSLVGNEAKTYIDNNGIIQTAAINESAFDNSFGTKGLMLSQSSTNLNFPSNSIIYLQAIDNVASDPSIISGQNWNLLSETNTTITHFFRTNDISFTNGLIYTESIIVKRDTAQFIQMLFPSAFFGGTNYANFDVLNGEVSAQAGLIRADITPLGDNTYRISITAQATASGTGTAFCVMIPSGNSARFLSHAGDANRKIKVIGLQVEQKSYPTPYIPTISAPSTRAVDKLLIDTPAFDKFIKQGKGTFVIDFMTFGASSASQLLLQMPDQSGGRLYIEMYNNGSLNLVVNVGGANKLFQFGTVSPFKLYRLIFAYQDNDMVVTLSNGFKKDDTTFAIPTNYSKLALGSTDGNGNLAANVLFREVKYYPERMSNSFLTTLKDLVTGGDSYTDGAGGIGIRQSLTSLGYDYWNTAIGGSTLEDAVTRLETLKPRKTVIFCDGSVNGHGTIAQDIALYQRAYDACGGKIVFISPCLYPNLAGNSDGQYTLDLTEAMIAQFGSDRVVDATNIARSLSGMTFANPNDTNDAEYANAAYTGLFQADNVHPGLNLTNAWTQAALNLI